MKCTEDFEIVNGVLKKFNGSDENVVIPSSVKHIGEMAFMGSTGLKSVALPEGLLSIGYWAFTDCTFLT